MGNSYITGGNVGIGTTNPGAKLDVNGAIHAGSEGFLFGSENSGMFLNAASDVRFKLGGTHYMRLDSGRQAVTAKKFQASDAGTASSPNFSFIDDQDTGIFEVSNGNILAFTTGGSEKLRINASGNVGIGTTGPAQLLHLSKDNHPILQLQNTNATNPSTWRLMAGGGYGDNKSFVIDNGSAARFAINSTGKVGIGTASPSSKLHAVDTMSAATGNEIAYNLAYTTNKATSGNDTGLLIAMTDTASPGTSKLLDLQKGGATQFNVDESGNVYIKGNLTTQGTQIVTNTVTVDIDNNKLVLNTNQAGTPTQDALIEVERGTTANSYIKWNESSDKWTMYDGTTAFDIGAIYTAANDIDISGANAISLEDDVDASALRASSASGLGLYDDGSNLGVFIEDGGQVGIGTTSPAELFHINGSVDGDISAKIENTNTGASATSVLRLRQGAEDAGIFLFGDASGRKLDIVTQDATMPITFSLNTGEAMRVHSDGNVGIGTTAPGGKLDVNGTVKIQGTGSSLMFMNGLTSAPVNVDTPAIYRTGTSSGAYPFDMYGRLVFQARTDGVGEDRRDIVFMSKTTDASAVVPRMVIKSSGNVGIGTTAPGHKLDVNGDVRIRGDSAALHFYRATSPTDIARIKFDNTAGAMEFWARNKNISFSSADADDDAPHLFIKSTDGNVGIGTTNPTEKLHVQGNLTVSGTISGAISGADGTFDTLAVGGGYGSTGLSVDAAGNLKLDGDIWLKGTVYRPTYTELLIENSAFIMNASDSPADANATIGVMSGGTKASPTYIGKITWNAANDRWDIGASGTPNKLYVSGNVGIGTTAPSQLLDVAGMISVGKNTGTSGQLNFVASDNDQGRVFINTSDQIITQDFALIRDIGSVSIEPTLAVTGLVVDQNQAADILNLIDGTTEVFTVIDGGNVGIGTTNPNTKLKVVGEIWANGNHVYVDEGYAFKSVSSLAGTHLVSGGIVKLRTSSTDNVLYLKDDGNVGIGDTSPDGKLSVMGGAIILRENDDGDTAIRLTANSYSGAMTLHSGSSTATVRFDGAANTNSYFNTGGKVGIGTTAPEATLDVAGPLRVGSASDVGIAHDLYFENTASAAIDSYGPLTITSGHPNANYNLVLKGSGTGKVYIDDDLELATGKTIKIDDFIIDGNVGIGTTGPGAKLEVDGSGTVLLLPQEDTAVAPTIAFGDGNTGFYEHGADVLNISIGGNLRYSFSANALTTSSSQGPHMARENKSATNPVWTFADDTDTGIGSAGADIVSLIAGATNVLNVTSGNVGIGTTAPDTLLHLEYADDTGATGLKLGSAGVSSAFTFSDDSYFIGIDEDNGQTDRFFAIYKNSDHINSQLFRVQEDGNVGIGTTGPGELLQAYL